MDSITAIDSRIAHMDAALSPVDAGQPSQPRLRSETGSGGSQAGEMPQDDNIMSTVFQHILAMDDHIDLVTLELVYPATAGQSLDLKA